MFRIAAMNQDIAENTWEGYSSALAERGKTMTEFITRSYGNKEFEIIIKTDSHEHYRATEDFARRLIDHAKPMTNGDRIRAMSDDDIVAWGRVQIGCGFDSFPCGVVCDGKCETYTSEECEAKIKKWLQQPAEVEDEDNN